jgi:DNA-binding beta-propeller fold protein YncE
MCVAVKQGVVIVTKKKTLQLHMYSLVDGALVRSVHGRGFTYGTYEAVCVTPDGDSVLVIELNTNRVTEMRVSDGAWTRYVGRGILMEPQNVDCNANVIVVSEACHRISVFGWIDGCARAQFSSYGYGAAQVEYPMGLRLLADGAGVVVADSGNDRLCLFRLSGEFVTTLGSYEQGILLPTDVLECASSNEFIVANRHYLNKLVKLSQDGTITEQYHHTGNDDNARFRPSTLASLPNGGCAVHDYDSGRVHLLMDNCARVAWMRACAVYAPRTWTKHPCTTADE